MSVIPLPQAPSTHCLIFVCCIYVQSLMGNVLQFIIARLPLLDRIAKTLKLRKTNSTICEEFSCNCFRGCTGPPFCFPQ
uniref:Uncharacterized protein n=1 Tax=Anguilla anguilla TaxID=7936 RepID=A0A0E9UQ89_ANGAN